MSAPLSRETKVGFFVLAGILLTVVTIIMLGSAEDLFTRKQYFTAHFNAVDGLIEGAKVSLNGIKVGTVKDVMFDEEKKDILIRFAVTKKNLPLIREDATAEIATQGVLGDKYISIAGGSADKPQLQPGSDITRKQGQDIAGFLSKSDQLLVTLNSVSASLDRILKTMDSGNRSEVLFAGLAATSKNLASVTEQLNKMFASGSFQGATKSLHSILAKIDNGTGTIGALVNDPALYENARSLVGGANRNRILRNIVRQTVKDGADAGVEETAPAPEAPKK